MAEYLDIVDENGIPTGEREDRVRIHATGLRHRTAHLWLARRRGERVELLLQKRSEDKDSHPGCYDISSAGHIPAGVEPIPSLLRELQEELGLSATEKELIFCGLRRFYHRDIFHGKPFLDRQVSGVYLLWRDADPAEMTLQSTEVSEVRWMNIMDIRRMIESGAPAHCLAMEEWEMLYRKIFENH